MKALILNSGMGKRMGRMGETRPKCLTPLSRQETILGCQLKQLCKHGIREIVITTGPFKKAIENYCNGLNLSLSIHFSHNPNFADTNYIFSIYCAKELLNDDIILMHGDLVFEEDVLCRLLAFPGNCMITSTWKSLPQKDFKAVIHDGEIERIGVDFFDDAVSAQPLYKLDRTTWNRWLNQIIAYCNTGKTNCYAEDALNEIAKECKMYPLDIEGRLCSEIDTPKDLENVIDDINDISSRAHRKTQAIMTGTYRERKIRMFLQEHNIQGIFVVHGKSAQNNRVLQSFIDVSNSLGISLAFFHEYSANPDYDSVIKGVHAFHNSGCDMILAIGGGSAMDVAKCIKLFSNGKETPIPPFPPPTVSPIPLAAVPTTAGSGSESTRFAVIYYEGKKQSITHHSIIPDMVCFDETALHSLTEYQRKSGVLDALCHAVESYWSVLSGKVSREYSREALEGVLAWKDEYIAHTLRSEEGMIRASNLAGRAINLAQTTAGHAMCYQLTSWYGISHGHAAAICISKLWPYMINHIEDCTDSRGRDYLQRIFEELAIFWGFSSLEESTCFFQDILHTWGMDQISGKKENIDELVASVNPTRLQNHPVHLDSETIRLLYEDILESYFVEGNVAECGQRNLFQS